MNNTVPAQRLFLPTVVQGNVVVPPQRYPLDAFPVIAREAIYEVLGYIQSADAIVAMSFLEATSIAIQGSVDVKLPTGEVRPASLNLLTIAKSGERKSTVDRLVMKPIVDFEKEQLKQSKTEMRQYRAELAIWEEKLKVLRSKAKAAIAAKGAFNGD
ncbi:DUF3987 domain-containing protein [Solimonas flava]|uniref:DUF3987 domain-containing protein n=1 Tax=Solimonas flava TaxID=415849 RepID=UPI00137877D5|nr:DUF3987 domain-containing protein [Solimonas flava]